MHLPRIFSRQPALRRVLAVVLLAVRTQTLLAAEPDPTAPPIGPYSYRVESNVFIPMRDGIRLAADIYIPQVRGADRLPIVLIRTPYGNVPGFSLYEAPIRVFASHGFIVAVQDKRGKYRSEGIYTPSGGDAEDGYDTIDWLSRQPWSNGRIGTYGCSYAGDVQIFLAQTRHPALKAMIPQASGSAVGSAGGLYRYFGARQGGAVNWASTVGWFVRNGQKISPRLPTTLDPATYAGDYARWNQAPKPPVFDHQRAWRHLPMQDALTDQGLPPSDFADTIGKAPSDPYWAQLPYMTPSYVADVPALFVNSWYDFGADVTLFEYNWFREHSLSAQAREHQFVIMSPGSHCSSETDARASMIVGTRQMGDTRFDYWQTYLTWFEHWLRQDPKAAAAVSSWPKVRYYNMGAGKWATASEWPVRGTRSSVLYLHSHGNANSLFGDGMLSEHQPAAAPAADNFVYDPAIPVPSLGGALCCTGSTDAQPGAVDQRPVEARSDVLVYSSQPLITGLNVTGPVEVDLYVGSSAVDTDFTVKLVDVYPDGEAFNVVESILRARYRDGQDKEVWMHPDQVYPLRISLGATSNYFGPGHRIRLEVSSSNFPEFDRNLNIGDNNAAATRWVSARNTVHHSSRYPSRLVLPVLSDTTHDGGSP